MAGQYQHDRSPFDEPEDVNPFADPLRPTLAPLPSAPAPHVGFHYGSNYNDIPLDTVPTGHSFQELKKKEKEIKAKEIKVNKREEKLKRKEEALARAGAHLELRNWPPFAPILHNDIAQDIPIYLQRLMYVAFASYLGTVLCLLWNLFAVTTACIIGAVYVWHVFLAIIYLVLGVPLSYLCWYRPLYRAFRTEGAFTYGFFFLNYMLHIAYYMYATVSPFGYSLTGIYPAIIIFGKHALAGIFYFVGSALFCLESLLCIYVLQKVYRYMRGNGAAARNREVARASFNIAI